MQRMLIATTVAATLFASPALAQLSCDYSGAVPAYSTVGPVPANETDELVPTTPPVPGEDFGAHVDVDGQRAVVSSGDYSAPGNPRVHVFELSGTQWVETAVLPTPLLEDPPDVAVSGNRIAAGARGGVYLFAYDAFTSSWSQTQFIPCPGSCVTFATSVALEGNYLAIGDSDANNPQTGIQSGNVRIYEGTLSGTFNLFATLHPGRASNLDFFGGTVDFSGQRLLVAAKGTNIQGTPDTGSVFVYRRTSYHPVNASWVLEQRIDNPTPFQGAGFGADAAISGDLLIAGSPIEVNGGVAEAGAAYVYGRSGATWSLRAKLAASDPYPLARFGQSLALDGQRALISAPCDNGSGTQGVPCPAGRGSAYLYQATSAAGTVWGELKKLVLASPTTGDQLGTSVALDGMHAVAGAIEDDLRGGSAYVFEAPVSVDMLATPLTLSLAAGGSFTLHLDAGPANAGADYFVFGGSCLDLAGGVPLTPNCNLPFGGALCFSDPYVPYVTLATDPNFSNFAGNLDAQGRATATYTIAPGENPSYLSAGGSLYHMFLLTDGMSPPDFTYVSELSSVTIVP